MQNQQEIKQHDRLGFWDLVLILGVTISPMTELRIWKIGPSELLLVLWSVRHIFKILQGSLSHFLFRFWVLFLLTISLGAIFGTQFYPEETTAGGLLTYVYFAFVSMAIVTGFRNQSAAHIWKIMKTIGFLVSIWYIFLYGYSEYVSREFMGINLWYRDVRFAGGANNPHQIAVTISSIGFLNIIQIFDKKTGLFQKILCVLCTASCFIIARGTKSSTLIVALVITLLIFLYYLSVRSLDNERQRWIVFSVIIIAAALGIGLFKEYLYEMVYEWIADDPNGLGRINIFSSIGATLRKNWLIGLGPGIHAMDGTMEYHNSYLEILAMGGIVGFAIFSVFTVHLYASLRKDPSMLFVIAPVYFYGLAGFSMRRSIFWVMVALLIAYSELLPQNEGSRLIDAPQTDQADSAHASQNKIQNT